MAKRGRPPKGIFDNNEQAQFLDLIKRGDGPTAACERMQAGYRRFLATTKADKKFFNDFKLAERSKDERAMTSTFRDWNYDKKTALPDDEEIPLHFRFRAREQWMSNRERSKDRQYQRRIKMIELAKLDEILQRLKALEDGDQSGEAGRKGLPTRAQPPQRD